MTPTIPQGLADLASLADAGCGEAKVHFIHRQNYARCTEGQWDFDCAVDHLSAVCDRVFRWASWDRMLKITATFYPESGQYECSIRSGNIVRYFRNVHYEGPLSGLLAVKLAAVHELRVMLCGEDA